MELRLGYMAAVLAALCLNACGGGGGPTALGIPAIPASPPAAGLLDIRQPGAFALGAGPAVTATGDFSSPPSGPIAFPVNGVTMNLSHTALVPVDMVSAPSLTLIGKQTEANGSIDPVFNLKVPDFGIDVQAVNDGPESGLKNLRYTLFGLWEVFENPAATEYIFEYYVTGFQTPNLPKTGTATYGAPSSVFGNIYVPSSDGRSIIAGIVTGLPAISANFGTGALAGTLTHMSSASGSSAGPWNDVTLSGSINSTDASITGTTATTGPASGPFGFSGSATGQLHGNFFGPAGQEIGLVWTLYDPPASGAAGATGKTAIGVIAATKQ